MATPFCVALTGGIGSGKSTVANLFGALGVPIIDADAIARDMLKHNSGLIVKITKELGAQAITEQGDLARKKLKYLIFNDDAARDKLEKILHPIIYQEIDRQIAAIAYCYCIVAIPLLIETNKADHFDRVLLIDIPEALQIKRVITRDNLPDELINKIIKNQATRAERIKNADDVIENTITISELAQKIARLHQNYLTYAGY